MNYFYDFQILIICFVDFSIEIFSFVPEFVTGTHGVNNFLQHISVASCSLVMNADNGVLLPELEA